MDGDGGKLEGDGEGRDGWSHEDTVLMHEILKTPCL